MSNQGMPQPAQAAPDIDLVDDAGERRRLADERGRWLVVYFYPKDDTPGCTIEACEFRDTYGEFTARGAQVWGISVLGSDSKKAFKQKFGLPFPLLADEDHRVAEAYGTWVEKENYGKRYWGIQRATFLIDPDGRIAHVWPAVKPEGHTAQVLDVLDEARSAHGAGAHTK
jgi:thioredoxin-dependent peroxiredoxin